MRSIIKSKRGQAVGLVTGLVFGVATLVVGIIIAFVVVSTLKDANLLEDGRVGTTVNNETNAWLNETGYKLATANLTDIVGGSFSITRIWANASQGTNAFLVPSTNFTLSSAGILRNATTQTGSVSYDDVNVTYTYSNQTATELSTTRLSGNFTEGIDNVADKLPTVLLVAAIIMILSILAILVGVWTRMRSGGSTL